MSRANDPIIKEILLHMRAVNIQNPEYSAVKKILEEGVDGRYLNDFNEHIIEFEDKRNPWGYSAYDICGTDGDKMPNEGDI